MAAAAVLWLVIMAAFVGWAIAASAKQGERRRSKLETIAQQLGGRADANQAIGSYRGLPVVYRFESRGAGSSSESWTEVDVYVSPAYPLTLHVRRQVASDTAHIVRGTMIDVEVGDLAFDPAFLVEAAPADVARQLLDREARCYLAAHAEIDLETVVTNGRKVLRLGIRGWLEELPEALAAIEVTTRIVSRVRDAFAAVEEPAGFRDDGSPYRPLPDDRPAQDGAVAREREVAHVEQLRTERAQDARNTAVVVLLLVLVGFLTLIAVIGGLAH
jgi:hypothetical protein